MWLCICKYETTQRGSAWNNDERPVGQGGSLHEKMTPGTDATTMLLEPWPGEDLHTTQENGGYKKTFNQVIDK